MNIIQIPRVYLGIFFTSKKNTNRYKLFAYSYSILMYHQPVLLKETLESIPPTANIIIDGTFGHGGHSMAIAEQFPQAQIFGIDRDLAMIAKAQERLWPTSNIKIRHGSYADIVSLCKKQWITWVDYILLDIWVNMDHFKDGSRGFSVHEDAILDMRFDTTQAMTAQIFINTESIESLSQTFQKYADFTPVKADELATAIIKARKEKPIQTTGDLRDVLWWCGLGKSASIVIFQAIRIAVNQELKQLEDFLEQFDTILNSGWRCAIMSYHSIEDRIVKQSFKNRVESGKYISIHKKAIKPSWQEVQKNRAARSAVLRIIEKRN
jgi:16S rRNA (cytosine1402-N4)-methyltransferase